MSTSTTPPAPYRQRPARSRPAGPPVPGVELAAQRQLERQARIRLCRAGAPNLRARRIRAARCQGRSPRQSGQTRAELSLRTIRRERAGCRRGTGAAGIDGLECPCPNHLSAASLPVVPLTLCRRQQPARRRTGPGKPGPATAFSACGCGRAANSISIPNWRRDLASAAHSALPGSPTARRRRPARRIRKSVPQRYYFKQTFGLGGEQEDVADGRQSTARQARHRPHHADRRALCRRRLLRQQSLCP